ncbi:MAG: FAD-dependent monooxygenase [Burkholderiaceae bacterium]
MTRPNAFQIAIHGRGPVALTLALLLRRQGLRASRISLSASRGVPPPSLAARALALSGGSWQILSRIIGPVPAGIIRDVDVAFAGHGLHTRFAAADQGCEALGRVVRHGALTDALEAAIADWPIATTADVGDGESAACPDDVATAGPDCRLTIHAEGHFPAVGERAVFEQRALFTEVRVSPRADRRATMPVAGVAYERFREAGPLALLPLPELDHWSVVWCAPAKEIDSLLHIAPEAFVQTLAHALGHEGSGELQLCGERHAVDLRSESATEHDPHSLRIGNAAQTLHPVAGQGLNLGLRDAYALAEVIGEAATRGDSVAVAVNEFRKRRERDRRGTRALTNRLATLGAGTRIAPQLSLAMMSGALGAIDLIAPLRRQVSRHFVYGLR